MGAATVVLLRWPPRKCRRACQHDVCKPRNGPKRIWKSALRGLCLMHEISSETADSIVAAQAEVTPRIAPARRLRLRLGIGGRLALGLAAVSVVILVGHALATRTTRLAVDAVRSMQTDHEPLAQRASAVVETLVAYDRAVTEYLQAGKTSGIGTITTAAHALDTAVLTY